MTPCQALQGTSDGAVLIVNDDPVIAARISDAAAALCYAPRHIPDTREFAAVYDAAEPVAIFLELFMPRIDGFEIISWLIANDNRVPVTVTARIEPVIADAAVAVARNAGHFEIGIPDHPISPDRIRAALAGA